jgi:hypothetical protein
MAVGPLSDVNRYTTSTLGVKQSTTDAALDTALRAVRLAIAHLKCSPCTPSVSPVSPPSLPVPRQSQTDESVGREEWFGITESKVVCLLLLVRRR